MDPELIQILDDLRTSIQLVDRQCTHRIDSLAKQLVSLHARLKIERKVLAELIVAHRQTIEYLSCKSVLRDNAEFPNPN